MGHYWPFSGLLRQSALRERLIVSLDTLDRERALMLVDRLARVVGMFKVGRAMFLGGGPDFVREIRRRGGEVFLDLKFHDRPEKVIRSAIEATRLGARMFDIHAGGCAGLMSRTRAEVSRVCRSEGIRRPHILAVAMLAAIGRDSGAANCADRVARMAREAADASLDGVFTSACEIHRVRDICGRRFLIVTCGANPRGANASVAATAADAVRAGADFVVIGGPITRSAEPVRTIRQIAEDMERGLRASTRPGLESFSQRPV